LFDNIGAFKGLKIELDEIRDAYYEKTRERNSWDSKVRSLIEIKNQKKTEDGGAGHVHAMKNEIRRLQVTQIEYELFFARGFTGTRRRCGRFFRNRGERAFITCTRSIVGGGFSIRFFSFGKKKRSGFLIIAFEN